MLQVNGYVDGKVWFYGFARYCVGTAIQTRAMDNECGWKEIKI